MLNINHLLQYISDEVHVQELLGQCLIIKFSSWKIIRGNEGKKSGKLNFGDSVWRWNFCVEKTGTNKKVFQQ